LSNHLELLDKVLPRSVNSSVKTSPGGEETLRVENCEKGAAIVRLGEDARKYILDVILALTLQSLVHKRRHLVAAQILACYTFSAKSHRKHNTFVELLITVSRLLQLDCTHGRPQGLPSRLMGESKGGSFSKGPLPKTNLAIVLVQFWRLLEVLDDELLHWLGRDPSRLR